MDTYQKNGMILGKFNLHRNSLNDSLGKKFAIEFFAQNGGKAISNDRDESGILDYEKTDLLIDFEITKQKIFVEVELKGDKIWRYIYQGIDIPARKFKYARNTENKGLIFMGKKDCTECLIIPLKYLSMAQTDCGEEYLGSGRIPTSQNFVMPNHGCHRVRKICNQDERTGSNVEDFLRIPYEYATHFIKVNGIFKKRIID